MSEALPFACMAAGLSLLTFALGPSPGAAEALLANAGLDAGDPDEHGAPPGWSIAVYGAQPSVTLDAPAPNLTGHSLRIAADEPSDTAIYQDVPARAGAWYRLSGWVRTQNLAADTSLYGAFCAADGPQPYLASPNTKGTHAWRRHEITFRAPNTGRLRVAIFFVGFGKGTGTVWFDGLELTPAPTGRLGEPRISVTPERLRDEPISPFIYGNFIEFLDHHVQGMRAQMLDDVSFEGLLPPAEWCYWQRDKDVDDHPWLPTGDGTVDLLTEGAFNGAKCCRLQAAQSTDGCGIRQGGLSVRAGKRYTLSLYVRQENLSGPVTVSLGRDYGPFVAPYAEAQIADVGTEWSKREVVLTPDTDDPGAELSLRIAGPGTLHVDQVTLLPEDHVQGWRRDVVQAVRALKPNCLRFGGSAVIYYDWKLGLGDPDRRVPFENRPWGRMEPNDVGIDEFLQFCALVEADPLVCVSYNVGGPEDAAAQVEYCNGGPSTKWGHLRAENGHPEPYGVRLWQVGNEQQGPEYEARFADYCRAMRGADPTIEICSSFPTDGLLERAADLIDYLSPHHYTPSLRAIEADLQAQRDRVARLGRGRRIRLAVTEWNHTAGDMGGARAFLGAQYNALYCARVLHLYQRNSDFVTIANRSNLTNSWWAGVVQTTRDSVFVTPAYYTMQLMSRHCGAWPLKVTDAGGGETKGAEFGSALDVMATIADDGSRLTVTVVNDGPDAITATLDLTAHAKASRRAQCYVLAAEGPNEMNDASRPNHIRPVARRPRIGPIFRHEYPAWSLTVIVVPL